MIVDDDSPRLLKLIIRPWRWAAVSLAVCWAALFLASPLSWLCVPILLVGLVVPVRRKRLLPVPALLLLSPFTVFFLAGIGDYYGDAPGYRSKGFRAGIEILNPHPVTRLPRYSGGCLVSGNEWITYGLRNRALRMMATRFGPPPACYDGPYPTKAQARATIAQGQPFDIRDLLAGRIVIDDRVIQLDTDVGQALLERPYLVMYHEKLPNDPEYHITASAALYHDRCLIIRLQQPFEQADYLILFDTTNGRPFAYYNLTQRRGPIFPPVRYNDRP